MFIVQIPSLNIEHRTSNMITILYVCECWLLKPQHRNNNHLKYVFCTMFHAVRILSSYKVLNFRELSGIFIIILKLLPNHKMEHFPPNLNYSTSKVITNVFHSMNSIHRDLMTANVCMCNVKCINEYCIAFNLQTTFVPCEI